MRFERNAMLDEQMSLCWDCARGACECVWMAVCAPVPGWSAAETVVDGEGSYRVRACPGFAAHPRAAGMAKRVCPVCQTAYAPRSVVQVYCSRACAAHRTVIADPL